MSSKPYFMKSTWTGRTPRTYYEAFHTDWRKETRHYIKDGAWLAIGVLAFGTPVVVAWVVHIWG